MTSTRTQPSARPLLSPFPLRERILNRQPTLGSWITIGHTAVAEIFMQAGYEWAVIDNEHSMMAPETIQNLMVAIQGSGGAAIVRLSHNHDSEIRKILDAGADGVICPMINSKQDAIRLIEATKYPPMGKRSYGLTRGQGYGEASQEYFETANGRTLVIAQIEHIAGVREISKILDVKGIDGVITGPYDMSGSLNVPGQLDHPEVIQAEKAVLAECKKRGIAAGAHLVHPSPEAIQKKLDLGYSFLALGTDFHYLAEGGRIARQETERKMKKS